MNLKQKEEILKNEQKTITQDLWGNKRTFEPYLLGEKDGDGEQLVYFGGIMTRPYYWLALIDSAINIEDDENNIIDELTTNALSECGEKWIDENGNELDEENDYPAYDDDGSFIGLIINFKTGEEGDLRKLS